MISVFVTNEDRGEFARYRKGFNERNWPCHSIRSDCLSFTVISEFGVLVVRGGKDNFSEKILLSDKNIIEYQDTDENSKKAVEGLLIRFTGFLAKSCRDTFGIEKDKRISDEVHCFIHWGGGDYDTIPRHEKLFQTRYDSLVAIHPKNPFSSIRFHSVSTIRPHMFDVRGDVIYVPESRMALDSLIKRFEDGQKYVSVKDVLTKFVVDGDWGDDRNLVCDFFARGSVQSDLRTFIGDPLFKWLKNWEAFLTYSDAPESSLKDAVDMMLRNSNETKKLASQLLSIPQLLKEWIML